MTKRGAHEIEGERRRERKSSSERENGKDRTIKCKREAEKREVDKQRENKDS